MRFPSEVSLYKSTKLVNSKLIWIPYGYRSILTTISRTTVNDYLF